MPLLASILDNLVTIALVLAIVVALVVIHEFGHFIVARLSGVRVHEFGVGFPPRALVLRRGKETLYTLNWLPLGGFVRLEGEDGDSADPRSFARQSLARRIVILLAGVAMNLALAWLIFALIAGLADPSMTLRIGYVQPGSPAAAIGLIGARDSATGPEVRPGDTIVGFDGRRFPYFDAATADPLLYPHEHAGGQITVDVQRADGSVAHLPVTVRAAAEVAAGQPALGVSVAARLVGPTVPHSPLDAAATGWRRTVDAATLILGALRDLAANFSQPTVSGPIGIVRAVGEVRTEAPPIFMIYLIGLLSANLAIVNALPIPPLDGGRVAVALVKGLARGRWSVRLEQAAYLVGFALILAFILWVSWFDIQRGGPGS